MFIIPLIIILYLGLVPFLFDFFVGHSIITRVLISILLIFPLATIMGIPFPFGIKILHKESEGLVPLANGVDSIFSSLGAVLTIILAYNFGFTYVLFLASISYLLAFVFQYVFFDSEK